MDVTNSTIEFIGEVILDKNSGKHIVAIDVSTSSVPKKRYVIYRNEKSAFDLIKNFEANQYKVGDKIDFNYNITSLRNGFNTIWKIFNHKRNS